MFNATAFAKAENPLLRELLAYIMEKKPKSDFSEKIHQKVIEAKFNEHWRTEFMHVHLQIQQAHSEGIAEGTFQEQLKSIKILLKKSFSKEDILEEYSEEVYEKALSEYQNR